MIVPYRNIFYTDTSPLNRWRTVTVFGILDDIHISNRTCEDLEHRVCGSDRQQASSLYHFIIHCVMDRNPVTRRTLFGTLRRYAQHPTGAKTWRLPSFLGDALPACPPPPLPSRQVRPRALHRILVTKRVVGMRDQVVIVVTGTSRRKERHDQRGSPNGGQATSERMTE